MPRPRWLNSDASQNDQLIATLGFFIAAITPAFSKRRDLTPLLSAEGSSQEVVRMTLTLPGLLVLIIIAAICGAVGRALGGGARGGLIVSTAIGFIGALLGPWVARQLHLAEPFVLRVGGYAFPILWSIIGGALFVALLHLLSGRRRIWS